MPVLPTGDRVRTVFIGVLRPGSTVPAGILCLCRFAAVLLCRCVHWRLGNNYYYRDVGAGACRTDASKVCSVPPRMYHGSGTHSLKLVVLPRQAVHAWRAVVVVVGGCGLSVYNCNSPSTPRLRIS